MDQLGRWLAAYVELSPAAAGALFLAVCLVFVSYIRQRLLVSHIRKRDSTILRLQRELAVERAVKWRQFTGRLTTQAAKHDGALGLPPDDSLLESKASAEQQFDFGRAAFRG